MCHPCWLCLFSFLNTGHDFPFAMSGSAWQPETGPCVFPLSHDEVLPMVADDAEGIRAQLARVLMMQEAPSGAATLA